MVMVCNISIEIERVVNNVGNFLENNRDGKEVKNYVNKIVSIRIKVKVKRIDYMKDLDDLRND